MHAEVKPFRYDLLWQEQRTLSLIGKDVDYSFIEQYWEAKACINPSNVLEKNVDD